MKLEVESTTRVVQLKSFGPLEARIWRAETPEGLEVHLYVTRVAVKNGGPPGAYAAFERDLQAHADPSIDILAIPLRMIL